MLELLRWESQAYRSTFAACGRVGILYDTRNGALAVRVLVVDLSCRLI
jgi:hypothetical protein